MKAHSESVTFVLMPGLHGTAGLFQAFLAQAPENVQAVPFSYPCNDALTYEELTEWVCQQLVTISGPLILLGESFSGPLSLFVAQSLRERVVAVILVASFVTPPRPAIFKLLPWTLGFALVKPLYAVRRRLVRSAENSAIIAAISTELRKVSPRVLAHRVHQTLSVSAENALALCPVPILYLQAEHDKVVPASALRKILRINSSVSVVVFPVQHFLLQSVPVEAWSAITQFIADGPHDPTAR